MYALALQDDELEDFYDAYTLLSKLFNKSSLKVRFCKFFFFDCSTTYFLQLFHRLQPGEAVTLNNRRFLHSRTLINLNGGQRFLQVSY